MGKGILRLARPLSILAAGTQDSRETLDPIYQLKAPTNANRQADGSRTRTQVVGYEPGPTAVANIATENPIPIPAKRSNKARETKSALDRFNLPENDALTCREVLWPIFQWSF
jgi:hypothetical protein